MNDTHYNIRSPRELAALMQSREECDDSRSRLQRNLRLARATELTPRQAEMLQLYFDEGKTMQQIARDLGVFPSTVSRTIARAEKRLRHCLQYAF